MGWDRTSNKTWWDIGDQQRMLGYPFLSPNVAMLEPETYTVWVLFFPPGAVSSSCLAMEHCWCLVFWCMLFWIKRDSIGMLDSQMAAIWNIVFESPLVTCFTWNLFDFFRSLASDTCRTKGRSRTQCFWNHMKPNKDPPSKEGNLPFEPILEPL